MIINDIIKKALLSSPWRYLFFLWVFVFIAADYFLNELYVIGLAVFDYRLSIVIPYTTLIIINALLVGLSINLVIIRIRALQKASQVSAGVSTSVLGTIGALLAGGCPGCVAGIFPIVVGAFGSSSFTLTQLPFYGIEVLAGSAVLLALGIYMLSRPLVCR